MGFTIGVASISQWRGSRGVDQELCKRVRSEGIWQTEVPSGVQGQRKMWN